jgi:flagellar biosynthesis anti-sigma factor FlgM
MKVNDSNNSAITGALQAHQVQSGGPGVKSGKQPGASDMVQLSSLSSQLNALQIDSPARSDRINQLSAMVANGSYVVDSKAVSAAIISSMQA